MRVWKSVFGCECVREFVCVIASYIWLLLPFSPMFVLEPAGSTLEERVAGGEHEKIFE